MGLKLTGTGEDGFESYGCGAGTVLEWRGRAGIGFALCPRAVLYSEVTTLGRSKICLLLLLLSSLSLSLFHKNRSPTYFLYPAVNEVWPPNTPIFQTSSW